MNHVTLTILDISLEIALSMLGGLVLGAGAMFAALITLKGRHG